MRKRTLSREFALQILYQRELTKLPTVSVVERFWAAVTAQRTKNVSGQTFRLNTDQFRDFAVTSPMTRARCSCSSIFD